MSKHSFSFSHSNKCCTIGISYDVVYSTALNMAIGAQGIFFSADRCLDYLYGKNPLSAEAFIRGYPPQECR